MKNSATDNSATSLSGPPTTPDVKLQFETPLQKVAREEGGGSVVAHMVLQRRGKERMNPLTTSMLQQITALSRWLASDAPEARRVKVVILRGGLNGSFTAGMDLMNFSNAVVDRAAGESSDIYDAVPRTVTEAVQAGADVADALERIPAVTIASIAGHCIGGGCVIASACDLRVAASDTYFSIPEIKLGIPLTWGAIPRLIRDIGATRTKELVMTGRRFTATEARRAGFLNRVVSRDQLQKETNALASELLQMSRLTLRMTKRAVDAISSQMVSTPTSSWADAAQLVAANLDVESREVAMAYLTKLQTKKKKTRSRL